MFVDFLSNVSIFAELSEAELISIEKLFTMRKYPKGSMIILEEEFGDTVFLVVKGTIKITRVNDEGKEVILSLMGMYELFGEMSLFDKDDRRSASVNAITECQLSQLMKDDLFLICDKNTDIGYRVMKNLAKILSRKVLETNQNVLKLTTAFSLVLER